MSHNIHFLFFSFPAGKATTDDELEEMLESGNAAVFTAGVSARVLCVCTSTLALKLLMMCL